jgi:hypothetical protein
VKVIIKYPNWYGHFQGLGFNLEEQPAMFDGIYSGTETRDAYIAAQHLQPYHGFSIFRYFSNLKPGGNLGGWVDTGASFYLDRYAEQLWITLFAKALEITLFDFNQMQRPLNTFLESPWKDQDPFLNYGEMTAIYDSQPGIVARAAGYIFEKIDPILSQLGNPLAIKCYRPYHSTGEDFLPSFLGQAGIPVELVPEFPKNDSLILLTASAAFDKDIVSKIETHILQGKSVVITSGLLKLIQEKGLSDIAELRYTGDKALINEYVVGWRRHISEKKILIPQIKYLTNDSWEIVSAIDGPNGWPLLHEAEYADGSLMVLVVPDNYADLYELPEVVLNAIRDQLMKYLQVQLHAPSNVSLYLYDNNTLIVESFRDEPIETKIQTSKKVTKIRDLIDHNILEGEEQRGYGGWGQKVIPARTSFSLKIAPHSFRVLRLE